MLLEMVNDWLQRLDDQCPGCAVLWFNQGGGYQSVGANPSSESLMD